MKLSTKPTVRDYVYRIISIQLLASVLVAGVLLVMDGEEYALSALLGGIICVVPNLIFVSCAYLFSGASEVKRIILSFMMGEVLKWLLTIGLFLMAIKMFALHIQTAVITYIVLYLAWVFVPLLLARLRSR